MDSITRNFKNPFSLPDWLGAVLLELRVKKKQGPPPSLPKFAPGELRRTAELLFREDEVETIEVLEIIMLLLTREWSVGGDLPALRALAGTAAQSGMCGTVWKNDELAYKCKTCERDPTCAICVQCFREGDHEGHDYAMIRTGGGCCDCGDGQAWQPSGFCKRHKGASAENEDPAANMDPAFRASVIEVADAVASEILRHCRTFYEIMRKEAAAAEAKDRSEDRESACHRTQISKVVACVTWLIGILKCGDGIRRVVGVRLSKPMHSSWLYHMLRLDGVERLPPAVLQVMHTLYFQLITDLVFKRTFLELFIMNYPRFVHAVIQRKPKPTRIMDEIESRKNDIMEQFSVQLFTVPAMIPVMMRDGGLLDILIDMALHLMEVASVPILPHLDVPFGQSEFEHSGHHPSFEDHLRSGEEEAKSTRKLYPYGFLPVPKWVFDRTPQKSNSQPSSSSAPPGIFVSNPNTVLQGSLGGRVDDFADPMDRAFNPGTVPTRNAPEPGASTPPQPRRRGLRARRGNRTANFGAIFTRLPQAFRANTPTNRVSVDNTGSTARPAGLERPRLRLGSRRATARPMNSTLLEEIRDNIEAGQSASLREAEALTAGPVQAPVPEVINLDRSFLDEIRKVQTAAVEGDTRDRDRLTPEDRSLLIQRDLLQQIMYEEGMDDLDMYHEAEACPLYKEKFGQWYRSGLSDARMRSKAAGANAGTIAHTMRVEYFQSVIMMHAMGRVIYDLRYLFNHSEIALHFVHHRPDLFRKFVRVLSMMQGMFPVRRHFGEHVQVEAETWSKVFALEIEIYLLVQYIVVAFCSYPNSKMPADAGPYPEITKKEERKRGGRKHISAPESRARLIGFVRQALNEWVKREEVLESMSVHRDELFSCAHTSSVHCPLHRLLSMLAHHTIRLDGVSLSFALSGSNGVTTPDEAMALIRIPIRIQTFLAQVRAGMWRRNGRVVVGQAMLYRSNVCVEWFVDMDVFLMQMCCVLAGQRRFISEGLAAFEMHSFPDFIRLPDSLRALSSTAAFLQAPKLVTTIPVAQADINSVFSNTDFPQYTEPYITGLTKATWVPTALGPNAFFGTYRANLTLAEYVPSLVEDILAFFVHVVTERSRCGFSTKDYVRRRLLHLLAVEPHPHSLLLRYSPRHAQQPHPDQPTDTSPLGTEKVDAEIGAMVEDLLKDIAVFERPHGMEQGRYHLKDEVWPEYDRFAPQISVRNRGTTEERYLAGTKKLNVQPLPFQSTSIDSLPLYPAFQDLKKIALALCSEGPEGLVRILLEKCVAQKVGPQFLDGPVVGALYFACMAVEFASVSDPTGDEISAAPNVFNTWLSSQLGSNTWRKPTSLDCIVDIYRLSEESVSGPGQEIHFGMERILRAAYARGGNHVQGQLSSKLPVLFRSNTIGASSAQDAGEDDPAVSERKRKIREMKKRKQAEVMAKMRASQEKFEKLIDGTDAEDEDSEKCIPAERQVCALCREETTEDGDFMGLVGFMQKTNIPCISRMQRKEFGKSRQSNQFQSADFMADVQNQVTSVVEDVEVEAVPNAWRNFFQPGGNRAALVAHVVGPTVAENAEDVTGAAALLLEGGLAEATSPLPGGESERMDIDSDRSRTSADKQLCQKRFLNWDILQNGGDGVEGVHFGFCGHAIHAKCFRRYFSRLEQSRTANERFEGEHLIELTQGEFLCPFCRRLANFLLPVSKDIAVPQWESPNAPSVKEKKHMFDAWLQTVDSEENSELRPDETPDTEMKELTSSMTVSRNPASLRRANSLPAPSTNSEIVPGVDGARGQNLNAYFSSPLNIARLDLYALRVLMRHGSDLHGFAGKHKIAIRDGLNNRAGQDVTISGISVLMLSTITTLICAEISCRSGAWAGAESAEERRLLGMLIRESRAQSSSFPTLRRHHRDLLWKLVREPRNKSNGYMDAFSAFVFLLLLWDGELTMDDVHGIINVCYRLAIIQAVDLVSRVGPATSLPNDVNCEVLLFLRRVAVTCSCFLNVSIPIAMYAKDVFVVPQDVDRELSEMLEKLHLFPVNEAVPDLPNMLRAVPGTLVRNVKSTKIFSPQRFGLLTLPKLFQELLEELQEGECSVCKSKPQKPALCLACGELFCYPSNSARNQTCNGRTVHVDSCGRGVGVLMVLKQTSVVVIRDSRRKSRWGSPYLDAHGEEDHELHRGKPLFLSAERYEALEKLWLSHRFDNDFRILNNNFLDAQ